MQRHTKGIPGLVFGTAIGAAAWLAPGEASAGPSGFDEGGYVQLAPGFGAVPLCCGAAYGIGVGGGYLWTPGRMFKIAFGGAFEHYIPGFHTNGMRFRFLPELRIGAGTNRIWGYGLIGGSFSLRLRDGRRDDDVHPGLGPQFGGGVLFTVWKGLYIGGEMDFDVDIYPDQRDEVSAVMWFKALVGYNF
jgi:hypothetical protein